MQEPLGQSRQLLAVSSGFFITSELNGLRHWKQFTIDFYLVLFAPVQNGSKILTDTSEEPWKCHLCTRECRVWIIVLGSWGWFGLDCLPLNSVYYYTTREEIMPRFSHWIWGWPFKILSIYPGLSSLLLQVNLLILYFDKAPSNLGHLLAASLPPLEIMHSLPLCSLCCLDSSSAAGRAANSLSEHLLSRAPDALGERADQTDSAVIQPVLMGLWNGPVAPGKCCSCPSGYFNASPKMQACPISRIAQRVGRDKHKHLVGSMSGGKDLIFSVTRLFF